MPWQLEDVKFSNATLAHNDTTESVPTLNSTWIPYKDNGIEITTTLIAPSSRWPDWHIRIHTITNKEERARNIEAIAGGFAIYGRDAIRGDNLANTQGEDLNKPSTAQFPEGIEEKQESKASVLVCSSGGSSGTRFLELGCHPDPGELAYGSSEALKPDANTNLIWQRTVIPTQKAVAVLRNAGSTLTIVVGVFALARRVGKEDLYDETDVLAKWRDVPVLVRGDQQAPSSGSYIRVD